MTTTTTTPRSLVPDTPDRTPTGRATYATDLRTRVEAKAAAEPDGGFWTDYLADLESAEGRK